VEYFTHRFGNRAARRITTVPKATLDALQAYDWPGNIRELQNIIERAVILSQGPALQLPHGEINNLVKSPTPTAMRTLADAERDHIQDVLRQARGVVGGRNGAAARLGVARTTLLYRMQKLGITAA
jgi:formate hydrogenlyase transcriptional activator